MFLVFNENPVFNLKKIYLVIQSEEVHFDKVPRGKIYVTLLVLEYEIKVFKKLLVTCVLLYID